MAEAVTARKALEDDFARTLRSREQELAASREELQTLQAQLQELAKLEAEEDQLKALLTRESRDYDEVAAEVAAFAGPAAGLPGRRQAGRPVPHWARDEAERRSGKPSARPETPARPTGASDGTSARQASGVPSTPEVDRAIDEIGLPTLLPQLLDLRGAQPHEAVPETPDPAIASDVTTEPSADPTTPERPGPASGPLIDGDHFAAEAQRLRLEILSLISLGRKQDAELLSLRMVELSRAVAGELSPDFSTWMTVVGQLQAEQGDWVTARSTFDRKNAIFRDAYGEQDPRYLSCLVDSAEALLACGDTVGAGILFQEAETLCQRALDAAHPFAIAVRERLYGLRGPKLDFGSVQILT
jgi:hypothetical protein